VGGPQDPLVLVRSRFWEFNGIALFDGDEALLVDPGITPGEIEELAHLACTTRRAGPARRVTQVVLTHSHHDHIRGWRSFPGAEVILPRVAAEKSPQARQRILAAKRKIDELLEIEDSDFDYPVPTRVFDDRLPLRCGTLEVELRLLPGHSDCTSVVWIPSLATLCSADYLVRPGLPYCRFAARPFERALETLRAWAVEQRIERVLPAHRAPIVGRAAVLEAIDRDREAMQRLRAELRAALDEGLEKNDAVRRASRAIGRWRGEDLGDFARQDVDNARRIAEEECPARSARA